MCSMALRWLARRLFDTFRSPMMCNIARRCSSRFRRRSASVSTCARSWLSAPVAARRSVTPGCRSVFTISGILRSHPSGSLPSDFFLQGFELLFEGDHLQLAADDHFLELLEIQNLLLQLALGLLQVAHHLFVLAHVAQDADSADHLAVRIAER